MRLKWVFSSSVNPALPGLTTTATWTPTSSAALASAKSKRRVRNSRIGCLRFASKRSEGGGNARNKSRDFTDGPGVKTLPSSAEGSILGQESKIPHALWPKKQT